MKILFVCHGNICRSPMAEFVLKALVKSKGFERQYEIESAAVSTEEIGYLHPDCLKCGKCALACPTKIMELKK